MTYKIKISVPKGKFAKKDIEIRKAMATMYASSPYLSKKKKDKYIKEIFN
jgi:hypothetical protein